MERLGAFAGWIFAVLPLLASGQNWTQLGADLDGDNTEDEAGWAVSMPDPFTLAFGAPWYHEDTEGSGLVRVFRWTDGSWVQKGEDIIGDTSMAAGWALCMADSNTLAVGGPWYDGAGENSGLVRVYTWDGASWTRKGLDLLGDSTYDLAGSSVSMPDANTLAMGLPLHDAYRYDGGLVRVYSWNDSAWVQKGTDVHGEMSSDGFGRSVSMPDTNTLAVGAYGNDGSAFDAGHVRVFTWSGGQWVQQGADIDGEAVGDGSGLCVSMPDAQTLAIAAPANDGNGSQSGQVRVYTWNGSAWSQKGSDIDGEAAENYAGRFVSMPDPNTVAIGADGNADNGSWCGQVRVYAWDGSYWIQQGADINGEAADDRSGFAVSMPASDRVAIGAIGNAANGPGAGQVRVYAFDTLSTAMTDHRGKGFLLYPDPATDRIIVSDPGMDDPPIIINAMGQRLPLHMVRGADGWEIDVRPLAAGTYAVYTAGRFIKE